MGTQAATPTLVVIESPYTGPTPQAIEANVTYARRAMADSLARNEYPIASHLLYTQPGILDDSIPEERMKGMMAGLVWGASAAKRVIFYCDRGVSRGMRQAADFYRKAGIEMSVRWLDGTPDDGLFAEAAMLVGDPV